ncbi:LOW QUALITY PROTEIN: hypothetical protein Cgig2_006293 [Carnegiea gigantea]|uniref:Uncharacterized protein n=1 Tax=Carnegiea gigantea TaxID=171969 RepID=A0A9Q1QF83_9CARY|nr:LOW QUALITY PROTEIN: hypothetical protein Cgig2_006293 [Carnegiea gigantea]
MFLTATVANPLTAKLVLSMINRSIGWVDWATAAIVAGLLAMMVIPVVLYVIYPPEVKSSPDAPRLAAERLEKMGPLSCGETFMLQSAPHETITRQVSEQVKWAMEAANSVWPFPHFDYMPTADCEPSHWYVHISSLYSTKREREASRSNRSGRPYSEHHDRHTTMTVKPSGRPFQGQAAKSTTTSTPYRACTAPATNEECSMEVVTTIVGGYAEGMTRSAWKAQFRGAQQKKKEQEKEGGYSSGSPLSSRASSSEVSALSSKGCLIPFTITLTGRRNKLQLLGVSALVLRLLVLVDVVEVGLKVATLMKFLGQYHQDLTFFQRRWYQVASPSSLRHSVAALTPLANASTIVTSSSVILGRSEVPEPLGAQGRVTDGLRSSPHDWSAPASLGWVGADVAVSSGRPSVCRSLLLSGGTRGGACSQNNLSVIPKLGVTMKESKQGSRVYLLGLLVHKTLPLLFPTELGIGCHLLRSGERPIPFEKFLRIRRPATTKRESFPVSRLVPPSLRALHRFYYLSLKLRMGRGLSSSPAGSSKGFLTSIPSCQLGTFPQLDSRRTKRKSYFQYFTFDFFLMAIMNPDLLLKQYHPKSPISLGALWMVCIRLNARAIQFILVQNLFNHRVKRKSEIIVESRTINCYTIGARLVHGRIRLGDYEGPSWDEELVDAPFEDECLGDLLEEEADVPPEVELVLVKTTWALGFDELGVEQGLPCVPLANNSSRDLMQGVDLSAMVISYGYETSTSGLRILGGTPATARPSIKVGRLGNYRWRPSTWGLANPSGTSPLDE